MAKSNFEKYFLKENSIKPFLQRVPHNMSFIKTNRNYLNEFKISMKYQR